MNFDQLYKNTYQLINEGRQAEALYTLAQIIRSKPDPNFIYDAICLYLDISPAMPTQESMDFCEEGIAVAEKLSRPDGIAYFSLKKAAALTFLIGLQIAAWRKLVGAKGWLGFALERDKENHKRFKENEQKMKNESKTLLARAGSMSPYISDHRQLAFNSHYLAGIFAFSALNARLEFLAPKPISYLLMRLGLPMFFKYSRRAEAEIKQMCKACIRAEVLSEKLFLSAGDLQNRAMSAYNTANWQNTFGYFWSARRSIKRAETLAREQKMESLLQRIEILKKSIKSRNTDTPNYLKGENRAGL
jgi:hypothetical protein